MKKRCLLISLLLFVILLAAAGCGRMQASEGQYQYLIYCLDRDENTHKTYEWSTDETNKDALVKAMLAEMSGAPADVNLHETVRNFTVNSYSFDGGQLTLDVSEEYRALPPTTEVLVRGALVRTLAQIENVEKIGIRICGNELTDALGNTVGVMSADQFVDNAGNEINSYEAIKITLYFAGDDGDKLKKVRRTLEYNTNISTEKLIVEQLIEGPVTQGMKACINPQTELLNVTIKDGIGYVSFDNNFLTMPEGITPEMAVYSIVNSLSELPGVNKVQISIDGETGIMLSDNLNLDTMFERNLDIVQ